MTGGPGKSLFLVLYSAIRISSWEEKNSVVDQEIVESLAELRGIHGVFLIDVHQSVDFLDI